MKNKSKRIAILMLALLMLVSMVPVSALAAPRPQSAVPSETVVELDLSGTKSVRLTATVLPAGASQRVVWASSNKAVATVSANGTITAKKFGRATIGVRPRGIKGWTKVQVTVTDSRRPESMSVASLSITLAKGEKFEVQPAYLPENSGAETSYLSKTPKVASISSTGIITARALGTTKVRARSKRNTGLEKIITVKVVNPTMPSRITLTPDTNALNVGDSLQLTANVEPTTASDAVTWRTSNSSVATVSGSGLVKALKVGNVQISATSKAKTSVKVTRSLSITDVNAPTSINYLESYGTALYFVKNDSATLEYTVKPETARTDATFTSSNSKIVSVDAQTGHIVCKDTGVANVTVTAKGTKLTDVIRIVVTDAERVMVIPARTTNDDAAEIKENMAKIDAIRLSAQAELVKLRNNGTISANEATARNTAIANAFANYGITWSTDAKVTYWNSALSASSDFRNDRMYYGMPYIQNGSGQNYKNRQYTIAKAVSEGYFKAVSGASRVYKMTTKRMSNYYVGCDCSSFASMAIWGTAHAASYLNTVMIASSSYYRTITDRKSLRPGDLLNKSGSHVIMFLYYTDAAKTQMMLIEQGGNTVTCSVANLSKYASYTVKRPLKYS